MNKNKNKNKKKKTKNKKNKDYGIAKRCGTAPKMWNSPQMWNKPKEVEQWTHQPKHVERTERWNSGKASNTHTCFQTKWLSP